METTVFSYSSARGKGSLPIIASPVVNGLIISPKKIVAFLLLLSLHTSSVFAQPTQVELDKKMKQEQMKKNGNDSARKKAMQDLLDQQKQVTDAMKKRPAGNNGVSNTSIYADPSEYGNVDNWKFPPKNTAMLASLPKKVFTKVELISFLNDVYSQLSKKLPAGISSSVQSIAAKYNRADLVERRKANYLKNYKTDKQ